MPDLIAGNFRKQISFMQARLGNLTDNSGTLISDHCLRTFLILLQLFNKHGRPVGEHEGALLAAALCHDLLEDTNVTEAEILAISSEQTLRLVRELTISFEHKTIADAIQPLYQISEDAFLIKLADISDNLNKVLFLFRANDSGFLHDFLVPLFAEYGRLIEARVDSCLRYREEAMFLGSEVQAKYRLLQMLLREK